MTNKSFKENSMHGSINPKIFMHLNLHSGVFKIVHKTRKDCKCYNLFMIRFIDVQFSITVYLPKFFN